MQVTGGPTEFELGESTLIAGVMSGLTPAAGSEEAVDLVDFRDFEVQGFEGKSGETMLVAHPDQPGSLLFVGLGDDISFKSLRSASGSAIRRVKSAQAFSLLGIVPIEGATQAVVEGSMLGGYEFREYKSDDGDMKAESVVVVGGDDAVIKESAIASEATMLARDLVNTPAKDKAPADLADRIAVDARAAGMTATVWDRAEIEAQSLGALLGVAAGSRRDPRVVILEHRPEGATGHLALVGKGITFDSGGLSLKTAKFMEDMKDDMSGAAVVSSAAIGMARLEVPLNVTVVTPLTDNAVGGDATRPGDVLRPMAGPTIEVLNTDAEGRLILADGLGIARTYEPDLTIDVATLTGAAAVALGKHVAAVFGSDSEVSRQVLDAAGRAGEEFWEMPLHTGYRKSIDSDVADIKNISGGRYGGAIVAALFLAEYAGDGPWAHLDIAGPARSTETRGEVVKGATGVGVRTLIQLARAMADGQE